MARPPPTEPQGALYVKLPAQAVDRLHRAAQALGVHKKELVARLVSTYVDPDSKRGLTALTALGTLAAGAPPNRVVVEQGETVPTLGSYSFQPYDPPEVMTAEQVAQYLQLEDRAVTELAESGELPGRKVGKVWRFSRTAVLTWLATPPPRRPNI